jgi:hypothetical protein
MEPEGSLLHSQDPTTCPCLSEINPVQTLPPSILLLEDSYEYYPLIYT